MQQNIDLEEISYIVFGIKNNKNKEDLQQYVVKSSSNDIAIYTACFGSYDLFREPQEVNEKIDYFLFTDCDIKTTKFKIKKVKPLFKDKRLSARVVKALSHVFLPSYKYTVWIDSSVLLRGIDIYTYIFNILKNNDICVHKHFQRNCVYKEIKECIAQKKDKVDKILQIQNFLLNNKYPEENGLVETAELFRKNTYKIKKFNELWWSFIRDFTYRDQLSFNFVARCLSIDYYVLNGCQWLDQSFKNYFHKYEISIKNEPSVDIIILVHNSYEISKKCIDSILKLTKYKNYKIYIVDNASSRDVKQKLQVYLQYKKVYLISNEQNFSFSKANNIGFKESNSEYVLFLNNDIEIIDKEWLTKLVFVMINNKDIGACGPVLLYPNYTIQSCGIDIQIEKDTIKMPAQEIKFYRHPRFVNAITGACFLSKREILNKVNCFDEIYHYGQEDIDLCLKIRECGYKIYLNSLSEVMHHESYTRKFNAQILENREKIKGKWFKRILKLNN